MRAPRTNARHESGESPHPPDSLDASIQRCYRSSVTFRISVVTAALSMSKSCDVEKTNAYILCCGSWLIASARSRRDPVQVITRVDSAMANMPRLLLQLLSVLAVVKAIAAQTAAPQVTRPITNSAGAPVGGDLSLDNFEYQYGNTAGLVSDAWQPNVRLLLQIYHYNVNAPTFCCTELRRGPADSMECFQIWPGPKQDQLCRALPGHSTPSIPASLSHEVMSHTLFRR
jgi:hypothetical protein